jgi:hypothetical protein
MLNYPYAKCPVSEADTRRILNVLLKESEEAGFGGFSLFWLRTNFVKLRSIKSHPKTHLSLRIGEGFWEKPKQRNPALGWVALSRMWRLLSPNLKLTCASCEDVLRLGQVHFPVRVETTALGGSRYLIINSRTSRGESCL